MSFWTLMTILGGGAILLIILAAVVPGLFTSMVNILRSIFEFVIDHLPKPLKYLIVIILVGALGSVIVTYTVGLSYVCLDDGTGDAVYKVPMYQGLALQTWEDLDGDVAVVTVETTNIVEQEGLYEWVVSDGVTALRGLVVRSDIIGDDFGFGDVTRVPPTEQFSSFFGTQKVRYDICWNAKDNSCALVRASFWGAAACSSAGMFSSDGAWLSTKGSVKYVMRNVTEFSSNTSDRTPYDGELEIIFQGTPGLTSVTSEDLNDCVTGDVAQDTFGSPVEVHVIEEDRWDSWGEKEWDFTLYNADYFQLMRTTEELADIDAGTFFWNVPEDVLAEIILETITSADKVGSQRGAVITFQCNHETKNEPFDIDVKVFGVNPFNPVVVIMLFVIMGILSVYRYFRV